MTHEIVEHDENVSVRMGDERAATKVHDIVHKNYEALHKDCSESVDALERVIAV